MLTLPIIATPAQTMSVLLGGQPCFISLYLRGTAVYMDLSINGVTLMSGAICLDRVRINRRNYIGFVGSLVFVDTQGASDPQYDGFGTRYKLVYLP